MVSPLTKTPYPWVPSLEIPYSYSLRQSGSQGLRGQSNILLQIWFQKTSAPEHEEPHQSKTWKFDLLFVLKFLIIGFYFSCYIKKTTKETLLINLSDPWKKVWAFMSLSILPKAHTENAQV